MLLCIVVLSMTCVFAYTNTDPIVSSTFIKTEVGRIGEKVLFINHFRQDSTCSAVLNESGCNLYRTEVLKTEGFILKDQSIPDDILLKAYSSYKNHSPMPEYDSKLEKFSLTHLFTKRIDYISTKKIEINSQREISYTSIGSSKEKVSWAIILSAIICVLAGISFAMAVLGRDKHDLFIAFYVIAGLIIGVLTIINVIIFLNTNEEGQ